MVLHHSFEMRQAGAAVAEVGSPSGEHVLREDVTLGQGSATPTERKLSSKFKEWVEAGIFTESAGGTPCPKLTQLYPEAKPALRVYGKLFSKLQPRPNQTMLMGVMQEGAWSGAALVYMDLARATVEGLAQVDDGVTGLTARIERYDRLGFPMEIARAHLKVLVEDALIQAAYRLNKWVAKKNKANAFATRRDEITAKIRQTAKEAAKAEQRLKDLWHELVLQNRVLQTLDARIAELGAVTSELDRAREEFNSLKRNLLGSAV